MLTRAASTGAILRTHRRFQNAGTRRHARTRSADPQFVHDEIENYEGLIVEKSGIERRRVQQFVDLLFQYIEVVPADELSSNIEEADEAIGETDPDDVLSVACALARDAAIRSDDSDFGAQNVVEAYSTVNVLDSFDTR